MRGWVWVLAAALTGLAGCWRPSLSWQQKLDSSAGVERAQGVMEVRDKNIRSAIPQLIERLEDDDVSVRMMADRSLRDMTGRDFGYVAHAPEPERRQTVRRWREWWDSEGRTGAASPAGQTGGKP